MGNLFIAVKKGSLVVLRLSEFNNSMLGIFDIKGKLLNVYFDIKVADYFTPCKDLGKILHE